MTIPRPSKPVVLAAGAYLVLTLAYTWPLAVNLPHGVAHDAGDPILNAWILWWTTKAVPLTAHWWNAPIFYPATGTLAFSEHLLGQAPIAAPLIALTGIPLLGYNVTLIASYFFSALGAHFLGYTLTRRHDAAFVARYLNETRNFILPYAQQIDPNMFLELRDLIDDRERGLQLLHRDRPA